MTSPTKSTILFMFMFILFEKGQAADPFLQKYEKTTLISDLRAVLGQGSLPAVRIGKLSARIQPMFESLPKQSNHHLGHATTRYALHRIILDVHGWSVSGLETNATTFNTTSLVGSGILSEILPSHIEQLFAEYTDASGFSLEHAAILAATMEHLVHEDQKNILVKSCELLNLPTVGPMEDDDMKTIIQVYMGSFLQSLAPERLTEKMARKLLRIMGRVYPGWLDVTTLIDDERETLVYNARASTNPFEAREISLDVALGVVGQLADHFVHKQAEPECQEIKENLLEFERGESGRIRLVDFYRAGLDSRFFFTESKEYLRALGALDETDALVGPKVIVPNYVLAKSNCLAHSHMYSICCINECEGLYGQIEHSIAAPAASAQQIASIVAALPSSTVQAPRNLSQSLLARLDEIAAAQNGEVLLHSRLFSQWMHHAFPRECPYPHLVGTTTKQSASKWAAETNLDASIWEPNVNASGQRNSTLKHIESLELLLHGRDEDKAADEATNLMWLAEDEQFTEPKKSLATKLKNLTYSLGKLVLLIVPVGLTGYAIWAKGSKSQGNVASNAKHYV